MKLEAVLSAAGAALLGTTASAYDQLSGNLSVPVIDPAQNPTSTLNATAWSLIYTYPLAVFSSWAGGVLRNYTVNQIFHQQGLASPASPGVIKPNVDTLYSRVVLDLSQSDVILTVPEINDGRYWVYPVYDPFGNVQAEIGVVNGNEAGDYLIRRAEDVYGPPGFSNDTRWFNSSVYKGVVNLPGSYGTMLIRLLLLQNTTEDLAAVHRYQSGSRLTEVQRKQPLNFELQTSSQPAPPLTSLALLNGSLLGIHTPAQQLEFAARIVPYTQPEIYSERYRVATILSQAGLYDGHYHQPAGINLTWAATIANASITLDVNDREHIRDQGNNWTLSIPSYQGNFGVNYASTAYVAIAGYQQLTDRQTLYPGYKSLGFTTQFSLQKGQALLVSFSGKPRLGTYGFWSLTVYGSDQYLIPNELDRYEIGDRTYGLVYQSGGTPVYGPNATDHQDGPFQILVQAADQRPPANWTGNWLPAASDFTWITRWYVPKPAMTNGSYVYPKVETIKAIQ